MPVNRFIERIDMNTILFYFSATGNSLAVARDLAAELGNTTIIPITKAKPEDAREAGRVGIVYPVYMFGLPLIVADFLRNIEAGPNAYFFSLATLGKFPGRAHSLSKQILKSRGIGLAAGFSVRMPGNYTPLYGAIDISKQEKMFVEEKLKIKAIAGAIKQGRRGVFEEKPSLLNFLLYSLLYRPGSSRIPGSAKGFWANGSCTKCGLCAKVCPVKNIVLSDGSPDWLDHCQHCMACLQWCPAEAIQYQRSTQGKKRYHHPEITALAIMEQR